LLDVVSKILFVLQADQVVGDASMHHHAACRREQEVSWVLCHPLYLHAGVQGLL
jgi:hypothetical protein